MSRRSHALTLLRGRDDTGSMILALLAAMIVLALLTVIASTAALGQVAARHDRSFTTAFQVADAGVQRVLFELNAANTSAGLIPANYPASKVTGTFSGGSYTAYAQHLAGTRQWTIYSTGTQNGVSRTAAVTAADDKLFFAAAFADVGVAFNGGNTSDTYDSSTSTAHAAGAYGIVGSNGNVTFLGTSSTVDGVDLYKYDTGNNVLTTRCSGNGALGEKPAITACSDTASTTLNSIGLPYQQRFVPVRVLAPSASDMTTAATASCGAGPYSDKTFMAGDVLAPGTYCYKNVAFNGNADVASTASLANPVKIYATGNVSINGSKTTINCKNCDKNANQTPNAGALQIYLPTAGSTFNAGSQSKFGMAVYGPGATCGGAAGDEIYGSLVCGTITNVGNWGFHYDKALFNVGNGRFTILGYQES